MKCSLDFLFRKWSLWILFISLCIAQTAAKTAAFSGASVIQHVGTCTLQQNPSACTFSLLCYLAGGLPVEGCGQGSSSTCCLLKATNGLSQLLEQLNPLMVISNSQSLKSQFPSERTLLHPSNSSPNSFFANTDPTSIQSKSIKDDFDTVQESLAAAGTDLTATAESVPTASIVYASSSSSSFSSSSSTEPHLTGPSSQLSVPSARLVYPSHASKLATNNYQPPLPAAAQPSSYLDHTYAHPSQLPSSSAHLAIHHPPTYHQHHLQHPPHSQFHHSHYQQQQQHHPPSHHHPFFHQLHHSPHHNPSHHLNSHHNPFAQQLHQLPGPSGHQPSSALSASLQRHLLSQLHMPFQFGDNFASSLYASGNEEPSADAPSTQISANAPIGLPGPGSSSLMREETPSMNGHYEYGGLSSSFLYAPTHNDFSPSSDYGDPYPVRHSSSAGPSFAPSLRSAAGTSYTPDNGNSVSGFSSLNPLSNLIPTGDHRSSNGMSPASSQSPPISTTSSLVPGTKSTFPNAPTSGAPPPLPLPLPPTPLQPPPLLSSYPHSVDYASSLRYPPQPPLTSNNNPNLPISPYPHLGYSTVPKRNDLTSPTAVSDEHLDEHLNGQPAEPEENGFTSSEQEHATNAIRRSRLAASPLNSIHNERQTHARNFIGEDVCGKPLSKPTSRIIGGQDAYFGEFPWQVHIKISKHQCGGALISRDFVITAAHCVYQAPLEQLTIIIGAHDIEEHRYQAEPPQYLEVDSVLLHPHFRFSAAHPDRFDVALLKLKRPASYTGAVRPVCLPPKQLKLEGWRAVVTGWGKTDTALTNRYGTRLLQKVDVPIIKNHECEKWHRTRGIDLKIFSEMMCAGYEDGQKDACVGDSGGPLVIFLNGRWTLAGITSAGFGCAQSRQPGIYHRVSHTVDWILENMNTSHQNEKGLPSI